MLASVSWAGRTPDEVTGDREFSYPLAPRHPV